MNNALAAIVWMAAFGVANAADTDLTVNGPFDTTTAVDNFRRNNAPTSGEDKDSFDRMVNELPRIDSLGYDFTPPINPDNPPLPKDASTTIRRKIGIRLPELSSANIAATLEAGNHNNCEDATEITSPQIKFVGDKGIDVWAHVYHRETDCGHFLGTPYQYLKGEGDADAHVHYELGADFRPVQVGGVDVANVHTHAGLFYSVVGFFMGPIGIPLARVMRDAVSKGLSEALNNASAVLHANSDGRFVALTSGVRKVQDYAQIVDLMDIPVLATLETDYSQSGLASGTEQSPILRIVQTAVVKGTDGNKSFDARLGEIRYIKDLSHDQPETVVVRGHDNIWKLLVNRHLDPRMYIVVEDFNKVRGVKLKVGAKIYIPRLWYVFNKVVRNDDLVLPGDSVGLIVQRHKQVRVFLDKRQLRSGNPNLVYPYEDMARLESLEHCVVSGGARSAHSNRKCVAVAAAKNRTVTH